MPCRDYETDYYAEENELKERCDFLARIACKAITALESLGSNVPKILNEDEVDWWKQHKINDARQKEKERLELELRNRKKKALSKLTREEKELLGLD